MIKVKAYHFVGENGNLGGGTTEYLLFVPKEEVEEELIEPYPGFELHSETELEVPDDFPVNRGFTPNWNL